MATPGSAVGAARPLRRALVAAGLATAFGWVVVLLVWRDGVFGFTFDDAFYYFGIARHLAHGDGSTFDGINATNGYHPLWMAICVIPFALGLDDLAAARALVIAQLVIGWGASLVLVASIVSREVDGWRSFDRLRAVDDERRAALRRGATATIAVAFVLLAANPFIIKAFVNGLESGVAVTLFAVLLLAARRSPTWLDRPVRERLATSVVLALCFLARTDVVFLLACLGIWCLAEAFGRRVGADRPIAERIGALVSVFGLPALTVAGYLVLNARAFGTPVQVSGLVKRAPFDAANVGLFVIFALLATGIGRRGFARTHGARPARPPRFPHAGAFVTRTAWFSAFGALLVGYYNGLQTQQWLWYYCPVLLDLLIVLVLAVADLVEFAVVGDGTTKQPAAPRSPARTLAPIALLCVLPLAIGFAVEVDNFVDPDFLSIQEANRDAGEWMAAHLPTDAVVASWDAGVVGYFSHRQVVNIDGVVNSLTYQRAMSDGTYAAFLRCERVGYVVNHGADVDGRDPDIDSFLVTLYGADTAKAATVIETVPFRYSGTTNTGGFELSGVHDLAVHVYEIPAAARGPRPTDRCERFT